MKKYLTFLLNAFLKDSRYGFLIIGLLLACSEPFGSRQSLRQHSPTGYTIQTDNQYNKPNLKTRSCRTSDYSLSSAPEALFVELIFSGFKIYLLPDTISRASDDKYIKSLKEDKFKGGRTARWYFAWIIFKDYPWYKKIFGGGFDYLEMFGEKFGEAKYDWPHNPIISAFLYSGIVGGIIFIWFLIMVIANYLFYLKRHLFFFISFVITFFFVFFSDTSLFNTPLFTILCLIPFFTKYLHLKEKYNDSQKIPLKKILFW